MKVTFLGKELGEASGWDGDIGECWWVYDFKPAEGVALPSCKCLQLDESEGKIKAQDNEGNDLQVFAIEWSWAVGEAPLKT